MLSLLIFIGEAVRDALDPRKLITGAPPPEPGAEGDMAPTPAPAQATQAAGASGAAGAGGGGQS
jgi:microcin C transport system permease protein